LKTRWRRSLKNRLSIAAVLFSPGAAARIVREPLRGLPYTNLVERISGRKIFDSFLRSQMERGSAHKPQSLT
jgi:hypothetical protein